MRQEFAYHCTSTKPKKIKHDGFTLGPNGYTESNLFEQQYADFLPKTPVFVSGISSKVWDRDAKFCLKLDITGLAKYPDFGNLYEQGGELYVEEDGFWFKHNDQIKNKKLREWVESNYGEDEIPYADFTGDLSWQLLGTCAVDADELNKRESKSIVDVKERRK